MKILLIIPFFGKTPGWMDYFLLSCSYNPNINWLLYSDIVIKSELPKNVHLEKVNLEDFNKLATSRLNLPVRIINPYKICDFRPAFGQIFSDFIEDFDFWGYCDLDLVFGRIFNFIQPEHLLEYDVITTKKNYFSGHFTIYRNNKESREFYKKIWNVKNILKDNNKHFAIDEKSNLIGRKIYGNNKNLCIPYQNFIQRGINTFKYRFYKMMKFKFDQTKVLNHEERKENIKILRLDCVRSDFFYIKQKRHDWKAEWKEGILFDHIAKMEIMYFHFLMAKKNYFKIVPYQNQNMFYLSKDGLQD